MRTALLATALAGCAAPQPGKMAWPYAAERLAALAPPAPERPPPAGGARGGPAGPEGRGARDFDADAAEPTPEPTPEPDATGIDPDGETGTDAAATVTFRWPFAATGINSLFGERADPLDGSRRRHDGVDLDARYGTLVGAAAPGVVTSAGWASGHGRQVVIEHAGGFRTVYSHLAQILVPAGATVHAGDPVGQVGNSGRSTGPHLHFEVSRWEHPLDPLDLLGETVTVR